MNYAIVLAGGRGERFWPLSRKSNPKQFLSICSSRAQIADTIARISFQIKKENIYVAASLEHSQRVREALKSFNIPLKNFIFEPEGKNTFPPIAVISRLIYAQDKTAVVGVFPSDHYIQNELKFARLFKQGIDIAKNGFIVTFGIPAVRPETGYGYIKVTSHQSQDTGNDLKNKNSYYAVEKFVEKPLLARAKKFVKSGLYYWNSGIFVFRAQNLLSEVEKFIPTAYKIIARITSKNNCLKNWKDLPSISIDYAIAEKSNIMAVLPCDCGWSDMGSWHALGEVMPKDNSGNILKGNCFDLESKNTFVWSDGHAVATLGLNDIIVVNTKDALLVCPKSRAQDVKKLVGLLGKSKFRDKL